MNVGYWALTPLSWTEERKESWFLKGKGVGEQHAWFFQRDLGSLEENFCICYILVCVCARARDILPSFFYVGERSISLERARVLESMFLSANQAFWW